MVAGPSTTLGPSQSGGVIGGDYTALTSRERPLSGQAGRGYRSAEPDAYGPPQRHTDPVTREDG